MRTFGVLTENGEVIYLFESYKDIDLEDTELVDGDAIIRIDSYTILAQGPAKTWRRNDDS